MPIESGEGGQEKIHGRYAGVGGCQMFSKKENFLIQKYFFPFVHKLSVMVEIDISIKCLHNIPNFTYFLAKFHTTFYPSPSSFDMY